MAAAETYRIPAAPAAIKSRCLAEIQGGLRPNYRSGNSTMPRVFGEQHVAVLLYDNDDITWIQHLYFERDRFDEVIEKDGWLFARKGDGYVAVWSENGYEIGRLGPYAGRELICRAAKNAWLVECGRKADNGSFDAFVKAISETEPVRKDDQLMVVGFRYNRESI